MLVWDRTGVSIYLYKKTDWKCECLLSFKLKQLVQNNSRFSFRPRSFFWELFWVYYINKNAFQQDVYRPLVDRIPLYPRGVCPTPLGCTPTPQMQTPRMQNPPPRTEGMTHACENITFPQLLLQAVIISGRKDWHFSFQYVCRNLLYKMWPCTVNVTLIFCYNVCSMLSTHTKVVGREVYGEILKAKWAVKTQVLFSRGGKIVSATL